MNRCNATPAAPPAARRPPRHRVRFLIHIATAALASTCLAALTLSARQSQPSKYDVMAAYLYNFGRFVKWPAVSSPKPDDSFSICVLGQDPFGPALDAALAGQTIDKKPVETRRIARPADAANCRILFISASEEGRLQELLPVVNKFTVLTVSDIPQFSRRGGMIEFVIEKRHVRFQVNRTAAENAGLGMSSALLKVAVAVLQNNRSGG
jgi:YfiR/HmsC-like